MITSQAEIRRSLQGALLLARGDAGGMGWFDLSFDGFWRSFAAPLLALPLYGLLLAERRIRFGGDEPLGPALAAETLAYLVDVVTFPLLALALTRFLALGARYVPLVVATNWAVLPQVAALLGAVVVGGAVPPLRPVLPLLAWLAMLAYQWFVVRTALSSTAGVAAAFVTMNLLVGIVLYRLVDGLVGG